MRHLHALSLALMPIVAGAGAAIMRIYEAEFDVRRKQDDSPLTLADLESQRLIIEGLGRITPRISPASPRPPFPRSP